MPQQVHASCLSTQLGAPCLKLIHIRSGCTLTREYQFYINFWTKMTVTLSDAALNCTHSIRQDHLVLYVSYKVVSITL